MQKYYSIMTSIGVARYAQALVDGVGLEITHMAVGDGNGLFVEPWEGMAGLVNEVWRGEVNRIALSEENPNWITIEGKIPVDVGGWWIREVGLFDSAGDLVAVSNYPPTEKPVLADGAGQDLYIRLPLAVENTSAITLTIEPSVVMASRQYVDSITEVLAETVKAGLRRAFFYTNTM
ncbi:phage tail protein [Desulforegula conservatrix]|uniref:phage tail protein n=1 Tax=Desulforegula conservatrix TaxID=153026 RepID=UPI0004232B6F|nr:phage tail protein [Desulforegula conservatrix]